jgi:hypothetical protein
MCLKSKQRFDEKGSTGCTLTPAAMTHPDADWVANYLIPNLRTDAAATL